MFEFFFKYPREVYESASLGYAEFIPDTWLYSGCVVAALLTGALLLRRRRLGVARRTSVWVIQLAMLAVVAWVLKQPELATEKLRDGDNVLALVLDTSASMAYGLPESRLSEANRALSGGWAESLAGKLSLARYTLGGQAREVNTFDGVTAEAQTTAIGAALTSILADARSTPLAGIVLASDGRDTAGGVG